MRPIRLYLHRFVNGALVTEIARSGATPCEAKGRAFVALEETIRAQAYPAQGWRLQKQSDITHLIPGARKT
jgi:hypothetical protein